MVFYKIMIFVMDLLLLRFWYWLVSGELVTTMAQTEPPTETALMRAEIASLAFNPDRDIY